MVRFLIKAVFGGETLIIGKGLLQGGAYFDLIVKWWGIHLTPRVYRKKYVKSEDAHIVSKNQNKLCKCSI